MSKAEVIELVYEYYGTNNLPNLSLDEMPEIPGWMVTYTIPILSNIDGGINDYESYTVIVNSNTRSVKSVNLI